jgi:hypothetical protein
MSKNLTRKGLAFGATVALGTTLFAGAPASAAGIDNGSVSLVPTVGAEYDIIAGGNLALKANSASSVTGSGKYLKFQVEDAAAKTTVKYASSTQYSVANWDSYANTGDVTTITKSGTHKFKVGDKIVVSGATDTDVNGTFTITGTTATTVSFAQTSSGLTLTTSADADIALVASTPASGKYIYDTKNDSNTSDKTISLQSTDEDVTQSVTVTAWIDDNDNGSIDSTEYQSPARTVRFLKHSDVTPTVAFNPIAVGSDSTVVATVTFSPVLNGLQLANSDNRSSAAGAVVANFTRPGSTKSIVSASTSYSNTTKQWTVTSVAMSNNNVTNTDANTSTDGSGWNIDQPATYTSLAIDSAQVKKDVVTVTTGTTAHGLQVGDTVVVSGATTTKTWVNGTVKITAVPSTTTFSYAAATTGQTDDATATAPGGSPVVSANVPTRSSEHTQGSGTAVTNVTGSKILRNYAVAGTYSAQVLLYKDASTNALTKLGAAATSSGVAVTASSATIEAVSSASLSATASNASTVYTGTKTANFVGKVLDADGAAVGAGLDAAITATTVTSAGTVKINGTTVVSGSVVYAKTDANGQVAIAVENSSALANESVELDLDIQGVDAADVTATWGEKVYSIVDLNDNSAVASGARTRAVANGASYTFDLLVQDQFKAPAGADIRLKAVVAGRSASTQIVALNAGRATLTVADAGLATTGDTTVNLSFQLATAGVWADVDTDSYNDWDGAGSGDLAAVAIKYYTQTDALTLNADAANYPSTTAADYSAATTTKALTAVDARVSNAATSTVVAAGKAVVSGNVANATTGAAKSGQVVTITGAGLLFKSGDVWTIGSASQIAADGTFAFDIYSANPGTITVTVAAGSVTKTAKLTFTGASTTSKKLTVTPNAATYIAGQTVLYTVKLTDGNGNAVDTTAPAATPAAPYISVSYAGPGIISGSLPVETDADGIATVRIVTGVVDTQAAVLTVKYDQNYDGDFADEYDLTVSSSVAAYVAPAVVAPEVKTTIVGVTKAIRVRVENAKGEEVEVVVNGKTVAVAIAGTNSKLWVLAATKGTKSVKVYVDGDLAAVKTVTVK